MVAKLNRLPIDTQEAMYRLQVQTALVDKAEQRLDQARAECKQAQEQQTFTIVQMERIKNQGTNEPVQNREQMISQLQGQLDVWAAQMQ